MKFTKTASTLMPVLVPVLVIAAMTAAGATSTSTAEGYGGATASSQALPWETALGSLANGLTGNTAKIIAVIAIFVAGVALIFGEDLGLFARRLLMIVIACGFLIGAGSFVSGFVSGISF